MPGFASLRRRGIVAVALAALACCVAAGRDVEQIPLPATAAQGVARGFAYKGAELCVRCHRSEQSAWVDTSTTAVWRHDAHSVSHLALSSDNPRTRGMEAALGIKAARTAACVACHTHPAAEPAPEEETAVVHAGISCETCHGAGSGYFEAHMEKRWRFLPTAEKEALGMHDLRNPARKAENCLSCHLGDVASGKVITHAMYAAGHPPLPAFEMEAFGKGMGAHWKRVWEKAPQVQAAARDAGYRTEAADDIHRALIGALTALEQTAGIVTAHAAAVAADPRGTTWPELSLYDCQACHHQLRVPSWRQEAGYGGLVPGRPSLVRWPRSLAAVAFEAAGTPTDVDALMAPYRDLLNSRPFGDEVGLRRPAAGVEERIERAIAALAAERREDVTEQRARQLLDALAKAGSEAGDFESARLLAWPLVGQAVGGRPGDDDARRGAAARLAKLLSLDFPPPAAAGDGRPFWQTSLSTADTVDLDAVHEAFRTLEVVR
jgi:hypothetical protein